MIYTTPIHYQIHHPDESPERRVDEDPAVKAARAALREAQELVAAAEWVAWGGSVFSLPLSTGRKLAKLRNAATNRA